MATVRGRMSSRVPFVEEVVPVYAWSEDSMAHYLIMDLAGFKKEDVKLQVDSLGNIITRGEKQVNKEKHARFLLTFPAPINSDMNNITGKFDCEILTVTIPKRNVQENKEGEAVKANGHVETAEENKEGEKQNIDSDGREYSHHESHTEQEETGNENADRERRDQTQQGHQTEMEEARNDNADNGERDDHTQHDNQGKKEERRNEYAYMGGFSEELVRKWEQEPSILRSVMKVVRKNKGIVVTAVLAFSLGLLVSRKFQSSTVP